MCVQAEASTGCVRVRFSKPGNNTHTEQAPSSPQCSLRHFICCEPNELTFSPPYSPTGWPARTLRGPLYTVTPCSETSTRQLGYRKPKAPAQTEPKVKTRTKHVLSENVGVFRQTLPTGSVWELPKDLCMLRDANGDFPLWLVQNVINVLRPDEVRSR